MSLPSASLSSRGSGSAMNPYVFIVGYPRSGTTLLRSIVNAHPQIAIPHRETHWIPRMLKNPRGVTSAGTVTPELVSMLLDEPRFIDLGIGREELREKKLARSATGKQDPVSTIALTWELC